MEKRGKVGSEGAGGRGAALPKGGPLTVALVGVMSRGRGSLRLGRRRAGHAHVAARAPLLLTLLLLLLLVLLLLELLLLHPGLSGSHVLHRGVLLLRRRRLWLRVLELLVLLWLLLLLLLLLLLVVEMLCRAAVHGLLLLKPRRRLLLVLPVVLQVVVVLLRVQGGRPRIVVEVWSLKLMEGGEVVGRVGVEGGQVVGEGGRLREAHQVGQVQQVAHGEALVIAGGTRGHFVQVAHVAAPAAAADVVAHHRPGATRAVGATQGWCHGRGDSSRSWCHTSREKKNRAAS